MTQRAKKPGGRKPPARIKNYLSDMPVKDSLGMIHEALAAHGARRILNDYGERGQITAISFEIIVNGQSLAFTLPNRFERVMSLVEAAWREMGKSLAGDALREQALKTSWANIRDWVLAQMALIDSQVVKTEEVFFPYLLEEGGQTAYERFEQRQLLPGNVTEGHYRIEEGGSHDHA